MPHYARRPPRLHFPAEALAESRTDIVVPVAGSFTVGRMAGTADLVLRRPGVNKRHARFSLDDDGNVIVEHMTDIVATSVGHRDARDGPVKLCAGDVVYFNSATTRCIFVADEEGLLVGARRWGDWVVLQHFDGMCGHGLRLAIQRHPTDGSIEVSRIDEGHTVLPGGDGVTLGAFVSRLLASTAPPPSVCQAVVEAVAGRDLQRDLEVGFDGVIRPGVIVAPGPLIPDTLGRFAAGSTGVATPTTIAGWVRTLFPDATRVNDELLEELALLDDDALRGVPG